MGKNVSAAPSAPRASAASRAKPLQNRQRASHPQASPPAVRPLPFVFLNAAISLDGKLAPDTRQFASFGSKADQRELLRLRTEADAVMCGAGTACHNVTMGPGSASYRALRRRKGRSDYNLRVVVSGRAHLSPQASIFQHRFSPVIVLTTELAPKKRVRALEKVAHCVRAFGRTEVDFVQALAWLRQEWDVKHLLCEGGGKVNAALFKADLVDAIHLTLCPLLIGGSDAPTLADGAGALALADAPRFELAAARRLGNELFLVYQRAPRFSSK